MEEESKMEEAVEMQEKANTEEVVNKEQEKIEELEDRIKRVMAEFENYKKRTVKERDFLYSSITSDIISGFLPVLDSIEKALQTDSTDEGLKQGLDLIGKQILDVMKLYKVEIISTIGEIFDPELHEAVSHIEDEKYKEKEIVSEFRKGYKIDTKVIRHAMVVVAN